MPLGFVQRALKIGLLYLVIAIYTSPAIHVPIVEKYIKKIENGTAYKMLLDGTVQAASTHVPELFLHKSLPECLKAVSLNPLNNDEKAGSASELKLCLDNVNPKGALFTVLQEQAEMPQTVIAAIGSERGWTAKERALLEGAGYIRCGMGPRVMRTETAATVSASIIGAAMGWLN
mgnify:CR=1 FL=1